MTRSRRFFGSAFGFAVLGFLALAVWALISGGLFDSAVARQLRASSVYAAPGISVDEPAAERIIGNRRLVVAFLPPGTELDEVCDDLDGAASGTIALLLTRDGKDYEAYPCSRFDGYDDERFGEAFTAERYIDAGIDGFYDRPLETLKVAVVNYDFLVDAGTIPPDSRTVSPSLPRYVIAGTAVGAVLLGALALYLAGRLAARTAALRRERREAESDAGAELSAAAAALAQAVIDLDGRYTREQRAAGSVDSGFSTAYRRLVDEYAGLLPELGRKADDVSALRQRVEKLLSRARQMSGRSSG